MTEPVLLRGTAFDVGRMARVAGGAGVLADPDALDLVAANARTAAAVAARRDVYGRTTGVGAARGQSAGASHDHGAAILRSHAAGWGDLLPTEVVRLGLAVRANQLLVAASGAGPGLVTALVDLANAPEDELPVVHRHGGLGTGDLTALAEVGLTLAGERPRVGGRVRRDVLLGAEDALPLLSSNAFTIAEAALAVDSMARYAASATIACSLTFVALQGNPEAFDATAEAGMPFDGARQVAGEVRELVAGQPVSPGHIQDFFGLRTWPQVHGPVLDSLARLRTVVEAMATSGTENPRFANGDVAHHGGFHAAYLAQSADSVLQALVRSGQAVQSRVSHLLTDRSYGLPLFLSDGTPGSSGLLIAEYVAASALSQIREVASAPSSVHAASVSAGIEDDAGFAPQAAARLSRAAAAYRRLVAVELVCAVRALRWRDAPLAGRLGDVWADVEGLPDALEDRDLAEDFDTGEAMVGRVPGSGVSGPARRDR